LLAAVAAVATAGAQEAPSFRQEMERRLLESSASKNPIRSDIKDPIEKPVPTERFSKDEVEEQREQDRVVKP